MKKTPPRLLARTLTVTFATVAVILTVVFIVITLDVRDRAIGALVAGTSLDANYAQELSNLSTAGVVITVNDSIVARTGPARIYTLTSIDAGARKATRDALVAVASIAFGSFILAAIGSFRLARNPSEPITRVSSEIAATIVVLLLAAPAAAQQARPSVISIDSVASVDFTTDGNGNATKGVFLDTLVAADFGKNVQAIVRPQIQRLAGNGEWNRQIWVAEMRYERPGPVALRVEGGYIPSPVGLANLTLRPHLNPTIAQPAELFTPIPSLEFRGPRINLLSGIYPLGAQATTSATHWDARVAVIDTSPLRLRRVFSSYDRPNPPRFPNVVIGGGVTPFVGFRVGASVTHGGWLRAGESPAITADRSATLATGEIELSFRHTSLTSELVYDALETSLGTRSMSGWYVQGMQTLAPRWFLAGRVDRIQTMLPTAAGLEQNFNSNEQTLGFRLTHEITLRVSHRMRQTFGRDAWDHFGAASVVWYRRWM